MRSPALAAVALVCAGCAGVTVVPGHYAGDRRMWDGLVSPADALPLPGRPRAAIAPHHLIDGFELAAFWRALAASGPAPVVVVIGPDHFGRGGPALTVGAHLRFETVFGALEPDRELLEALERAVPLTVDDQAFTREHSIFAHTSFIRRFLPGARFVPVLARWGADPAVLEATAQALHRLLPPDALVVASVDFSHYQPEPWATFHDEAAWATIAGFEVPALLDREVDSPESLVVVQRFAELRGAKTATRVLHTNSQRRRAVFVDDSTSHQYVVFTDGPVVAEPSVSLFVAGEVETPSRLGVVPRWPWHGFSGESAPEEPRLDQVRGREDRFFMGPDLLLFQVAPGERIERVVHGLRVTVAGVALDAPEVAAPAFLSELRGAAQCLVLIAHRSGLPEDQAAESLRRLHAEGAEVVIGRGFGAATLPVNDGHRLWVLSLGDFLTAGDSSGRVLGVTWTPSEVRARTLPVLVRGGRPKLDLARLADELELPMLNGSARSGREEAP